MSPLITRPLLLRLVSVVAGAVGFYLPLAAVPLYADSVGTGTAAGMANAALLFATVSTELVTPRLVTLFGYRWALAAGLILLGTPVLVLLTPAGATVAVVVAVNAVRGVGFAVSVVAGGALTAALIPAERRGEGLALVGLVGGVPALLALPLGTWASAHWGYGVVFALTALVPLVAIMTVPGLPARDAASEGSLGVLHGLRRAALVRPAVVFAASASAAGVVVTFVPLAVGSHAAWVAPAALLLQPTTSTLARWVAGRLGDRRGQTRLLVPGVSLSVVGMVAMAATGSGCLVAAGAAVFGTGFGLLQNATLTLMYARVSEHEYGTVSAIWNGAYDLGMGAGALAVGALVTATGFSAAFLVVAATMLPAIALARREARPAPRPNIGLDLVDVPVAV
ncbi:MFS transporter [Marmoricola sp. URHB0036]|uniref:MFS transporter n=1 Tax=Marmoricola sp. URHB0036 TaxID=1298863 RepID=UPI000404FD6E|nr:MFS transporter [Marmoricola sp. URHB0036]